MKNKIIFQTFVLFFLVTCTTNNPRKNPQIETFHFSDDFKVNTADQDTFFINIELSLGFEKSNKALSNELRKREPQLRIIINLALASKTKEEASSMKGQLELRETIKTSINSILTNGKISEVYFDELTIN